MSLRKTCICTLAIVVAVCHAEETEAKGKLVNAKNNQAALSAVNPKMKNNGDETSNAEEIKEQEESGTEMKGVKKTQKDGKKVTSGAAVNGVGLVVAFAIIAMFF